MDANSVHVMKMASALAGVVPRFDLVCMRDCREPGQSLESVFKAYATTRTFPIHFTTSSKDQGYWRCSLTAGLRPIGPKPPTSHVVFGRWIPAVFMQWLRGAYVAVEEHNADYSSRRTVPFMLRMMARSRRLLLCVAITQALREDILQHVPGLGDRVIVLPDGADLNTSIGRTGKTTDVAYVGSLKPGKGVDIICRIAQRLPNRRFAIAGGNPKEISALQAQFGALPNVEWLGHRNQQECDLLRTSARLLLAPIQADVEGIGGIRIGRWTSPLKVFEAMASGTPLIASDLPVIREVCTDDQNCILAPSKDIDGWVERVERILSQPDLATRIAERALCDIRERYSWDCRANGLAAALSTAWEKATGRQA